ncbi:polygalacturonase inhibitor 1-like [Silene latifolia]|uniref:polygalacturonase inhibitor 1-like n=1 Tax=Silene latifolia TaxID=37657 RepID=UPI003D7727C6
MSLLKLYILPFLLIFISQISYLTYSQSTPNVCNQNDKNTLLNIKNKLGNPSSLPLWDPNTDCCTQWSTIQCNDQGYVTSLTIQEAHDINGPIPPFLDQLPYLTGLYFINVTNLSGPIPTYFRKLTNLTAFVIWGTKVTGPIPDFLGRFTNLVQLNLPFNRLSGPIPNSLGRLKKLLYLYLASNRLTGPIPTGLNKLTGLSNLDISSNNLSGPIPDFFAKFENLGTINLDSNSLTGPIPAYLGHMPWLTTLSLSNNRLTGPIPTSLGQCNLVLIGLANNKLTGDASFLFDKANKQINEIHIQNNLFKFDFSNVDLSPGLIGFNVSHNMIYGSLPKQFGQLWVDLVDVSYNQLCGPIPNGGLFKSVDPIIFSHNKCLCGGPLPPCKS